MTEWTQRRWRDATEAVPILLVGAIPILVALNLHEWLAPRLVGLLHAPFWLVWIVLGGALVWAVFAVVSWIPAVCERCGADLQPHGAGELVKALPFWTVLCVIFVWLLP